MFLWRHDRAPNTFSTPLVNKRMRKDKIYQLDSSIFADILLSQQGTGSTSLESCVRATCTKRGVAIAKINNVEKICFQLVSRELARILCSHSTRLGPKSEQCRTGGKQTKRIALSARAMRCFSTELVTLRRATAWIPKMEEFRLFNAFPRYVDAIVRQNPRGHYN